MSKSEFLGDGELDGKIEKAVAGYEAPSKAALDDVRSSISARLAAGESDQSARTKLSGGFIAKIAVSAAALALVVFCMTPGAKATAQSILKYVFPDRYGSSISLEGDDEPVDYDGVVVQYPEGSAMRDYGIYVDKDIYRAEISKNCILTLVPQDYTDEDMENNAVYLKLEQYSGSTVNDALAAEKARLESENAMSVEPAEDTTVNGKNAKLLCARWFSWDNYVWNGAIEDVYVLENGIGGVMVIRVRYFAEAVEGHAVRLSESVNSLELLGDAE